jgi:hypothetical protein
MIDVNKYLACPYLDGGRTSAGLDCWGQLLLVRAELGCRPLPSLGGVTRHTIRTMGSRYTEVSNGLQVCQPEPGAIAAVFRGALFVHVGVVVDIEGRLAVLETNPASGARWLRVPEFLSLYYKVIFYRDDPNLPQQA